MRCRTSSHRSEKSKLNFEGEVEEEAEAEGRRARTSLRGGNKSSKVLRATLSLTFLSKSSGKSGAISIKSCKSGNPTSLNPASASSSQPHAVAASFFVISSMGRRRNRRDDGGPSKEGGDWSVFSSLVSVFYLFIYSCDLIWLGGLGRVLCSCGLVSWDVLG